ncbi:hypothetical protein [Kitasatospora sp. P5_F3]
MAVWGRSEQEWDQLVEAGYKFLVERARLHKVTTYTELNATLMRRTGFGGFDFERPDERAAMGHLLGLIVERDVPDNSRLMISALVNYLGDNNAGPGFYELARRRGLLPKGASESARLEFWVGQMNAIYDRHAQG